MSRGGRSACRLIAALRRAWSLKFSE